MLTFRRLTSLPVLIGMLVLVTALVAGPLREFDRSLHGFWSDELTPRWTDFLDQVPNAVAGQAVCLPILLAVAFTLAWKHRTWRPILIAGAVEAGFYGVVGGLKIVLARTSPKADDVSGRFFNGGAAEHGWYGMTYPSGHAAEAILIYGAAAYLIVIYSHPDSRVRRRLGWVLALITVNAVAVAYYLGYTGPPTSSAACSPAPSCSGPSSTPTSGCCVAAPAPCGSASCAAGRRRCARGWSRSPDRPRHRVRSGPAPRSAPVSGSTTASPSSSPSLTR
ncbi:hypothetical protein [Serinicoccus marinus]|uniref:hypothetical protein n=1 Tax=Serinicoccus marinus TaxID=247333 RepID=UPI00122EA4ED|nr:hypothetical protein [Serinicoccus marinus]